MRTSGSAEFPPQVLREYSLIADGERGALCGPRGDITWLCFPRWHGEAVFSALVGGRGAYAVTPTVPYVWGGYYLDGTLIWRHRWVTNAGIVTCLDALALPGDPHRAVILRRISAAEQDAQVQVILDARAGFGGRSLRRLRRDEAGHWLGQTGDVRLRWSGAAAAEVDDDGRLLMALTVRAGHHHDLVLELADHPLGEPVEPDIAWQATENGWREEMPELGESAAPRDARHSYVVLRGLTGNGGGIVAAATTSLPERAYEDRNYDYRYVWIRDLCYAGLAAASTGRGRLTDALVSFLIERVLADGDRLRPAYTTTGEPVPEEKTLALPGYPGGSDVVGNRVRSQFQLDACGEALQLLAAVARQDAITPDGWKAAGVLVDLIRQRWRQPDAGVWELGNADWTHSRLACVAGLRAIAAATENIPEALRLADAILADTAHRGMHPSGRWQRAADDPRVDASLLLPALRGAVPADDPRTVATYRAVVDELTVDGYVYRVRQDERGLGESEGAFLMCGFLTALAAYQQGERTEAFRWFERNRASCGPPGLFAEEYDVDQRQLRGNLPQAFVHAFLLETATRLAEPLGRDR